MEKSNALLYHCLLDGSHKIYNSVTDRSVVISSKFLSELCFGPNSMSTEHQERMRGVVGSITSMKFRELPLEFRRAISCALGEGSNTHLGIEVNVLLIFFVKKALKIKLFMRMIHGYRMITLSTITVFLKAMGEDVLGF